MEITILGTSNSIPSEDAENTHLVVSHAGRVILVDCAGSPLVRLPKADIPLDSIDDIILTHFHVDHINGVPNLLSGLFLLGRKKKLSIYGLEFTLKRMQAMMDLIDVHKWPNAYPIEYHDLLGVENELLFDDDGFKVTASPVRHSIPNIGTRFEAGGKSVVYSSDTSPSEELVRLAQGCDLLIHEASGAVPGHSSAAQAGQSAHKAHVKRLLLIHYPGWNGQSQNLLADSRNEFEGEIGLARDFMKITL